MSYIGNEPIVSATRTITEITATAGQTVFVANGGYTVGFIDVFVNGAQLQTSDFTATNGTSITLNSPANNGDDIRLVAWGTFSTSNTYTQSATDALLATKSNVATDVGFKNRIMNGAMLINQRGFSGNVTTGGSNGLDRWQMFSSASSKYSVAQSSVAPAGFVNSLLVTSLANTSVAATDYYFLRQCVEGLNCTDLAWGSASAKTVTLSFWVRSSLTGTFGGTLENNAQNRSYPFSYTISSANTWEQKTITVAGDTTGTWLTTNSIGIMVQFGLGVGTTYSDTAGAWTTKASAWSATGSTSVVGTSGATFYLTGVQLEVGSSATPFDTRAYGTELALCQRYCTSYRSSTAGDGYFRYGLGEVDGSTNMNVISVYPTPMRATPTLTTTGTASNYAVYSGGNITACSAVPFLQNATNPSTCCIGFPVASGLTAGRAAAGMSNNNNTSYLILSAEL